jgi:hypothetical protein
MENVIARIVEIEKQCAQDIDQAEQEYSEKIEAHRRTLEEKKAIESARIVETGNARLEQALAEAKRQTEAAYSAASRDHERLYQDPALIEEIKEKITSILLEV